LQVDQLGISYFNVGDTRTFQIDMPVTGGSFVDKISTGSWSAGIGPTFADVKDENDSLSFDLLLDHQYIVYVRGDVHNPSGPRGPLRAEINVSQGKKVDFQKFLKGEEY